MECTAAHSCDYTAAERTLYSAGVSSEDAQLPVALRLSKHFYDTVGEEVTKEFVDAINAVDLSYRTEFRELFSAHFGSLRAEMGGLRTEWRGEMEGLRAEWRAEMEGLRAEWRAEMEGLRAEWRSDTERLRAEWRLETASFEGRLDARIAVLEGRMDSFQQRVIGDVKGMKSELVGWMIGLWFGSIAVALAIRAFGG